MFDFFLHGRFHIFSNFLVFYNGYQGLSWIKISSRFLFYVKSYIDSTIQILKIIFLRLRGENNSYEKKLFFGSHFLPFFELICNLFFWLICNLIFWLICNLFLLAAGGRAGGGRRAGGRAAPLVSVLVLAGLPKLRFSIFGSVMFMFFCFFCQASGHL